MVSVFLTSLPKKSSGSSLTVTYGSHNPAIYLTESLKRDFLRVLQLRDYKTLHRSTGDEQGGTLEHEAKPKREFTVVGFNKLRFICH